MMKIMKTVAERLSAALSERRELTQSGLAKSCHVTPAAVSQWVSGQTKDLRLENLFSAADYLGVEPRWLATGEGPMRRNPHDTLDLSALSPAQRVTLQTLVREIGHPEYGGNKNNG
jgi:transcriptional regulator with XRE-family HTH domain